MERERPETLAGKRLGKPDPSGVGTGWDTEPSELAEPQSPCSPASRAAGRETAQLEESSPQGKERGAPTRARI